ncbi:MAG: helix-turn-helix domain-containing protein [Planctomycetota bacterium]
MTNQLLTLSEAARVLNVKYNRVTALARENVIPVVRLGRQYRVDPEALSEFIRSGGKALPGGWKREPEAR